MNHNEHRPISDEQLNAFVDDELGFEEKRQIFDLLDQDKDLARQVQELHQLRSLMQYAYHNPPSSRRHSIRPGNRAPLRGLAAGLLMGVGALAGWYGNSQFSNGAGSFPVATAFSLSSEIANEGNLLIHISTDDPQRMKAALDYAEEELISHRTRNQAFRLEILTNDGGVELLRSDTSPYPERIAALLKEHDNLTFIACANALLKLQERGIKVELLPNVQSHHTAIDTIVDRLESGWHYLKV